MVRGLRSFFFILIVIASVARADETDGESPILPPPSTDSGSWVYRSGKQYVLTAEMGFPVFPIPAVGVAAGYYLNPKTLLQAEYTQGKIGWWFLHVQATTAGLHLKRFLGNSFYLKGGGDYRQVKLEDPDIPLTGSMTPDIGRAESVAASFAVGNQWQWSTFTLDVQWIGLTVPVAQLKRDYETTGYSSGHIQDLDEIWNRVANFWTMQLLRVSAGASF